MPRPYSAAIVALVNRMTIRGEAVEICPEMRSLSMEVTVIEEERAARAVHEATGGMKADERAAVAAWAGASFERSNWNGSNSF